MSNGERERERKRAWYDTFHSLTLCKSIYKWKDTVNVFRLLIAFLHCKFFITIERK